MRYRATICRYKCKYMFDGGKGESMGESMVWYMVRYGLVGSSKQSILILVSTHPVMCSHYIQAF